MPQDSLIIVTKELYSTAVEGSYSPYYTVGNINVAALRSYSFLKIRIIRLQYRANQLAGFLIMVC